MKRFYIAIAGIILSASAARAQQPVQLSLKDCMDYAIKHNYSIKNAQLDVQIQHAQNNETVAGAYPHINGKAELDDYLNPQKNFIDGSYFGAPGQVIGLPFSLNYAGLASISGSQLLFDGSVFIALKARNSAMELARQSGQVTEETVRYNVYKAYNSLVIAYRQYDIIKSSLSYARSLEHDITITQQNGFAEKIDVERTKVQVLNLATDSVKVGNLLTVSEQMLKYQMGMDLGKEIILTDTVVDNRKQEALSLLSTEEQYDRVPEYNVLNTTLILNQYNLKRYQLTAIPTLNAFGAMGYNYGANKLENVMSFSNYAFNSVVGLQLNVPIFNGFMRTNQVSEAKLNIEKSKNNIENMKQTIDFHAAQSKTALKNAILEVQSQRGNMELSADVLDLAQKKYKAGVGSNLEVNQAQTDHLQAQNNYFSALLDVINAEADLKKALGLLK